MSPHDSGPDDAETAHVGRPVQLEPVDGQPTKAGASLGRYVVLEEVGRGGMGRVLRAYDPKLEREVALKELHATLLGEEGTLRLVSEARAMARLSHPNVVAVYDVEDLEDRRLVLVMEYVAGQSLWDSLRDKGRDWRTIVDQFIAAGRGLAAAHDAGLLHRDFKPANVLIAGDGTVKVTDFGLAKGVGDSAVVSEEAHGQAETRAREDAASLSGTDELTEAGTVMGTPRYMAPEQHRGEALTSAADQYAFCVALWEALCNEAPFSSLQGAGNGSAEGLAARKQQGPPAWPVASVPRPITDAVRRGLAVDPVDRWPSMEGLLGALAYDPARRRQRWLWALAGVALIAVATASWQSWAAARTERCAGAKDQLVSVWDEARRAEAEAAMLGIDASYAIAVWEHTAGALDEYAEAWTQMHTDACEATTLRGEQSAAVMDLRMGCLHRAKVELRAVTDVLVGADARVVQKAGELIAGLPPLRRCADVEALQANVEPPLPEESQAVEQILGLLAEAKAEREAGRYRVAQAKVEVAKEEVAQVEYGPVRTHVALAEGVVLRELGAYEASESALQEALSGASMWRQWDAMQDVAAELLYVVGVAQKRSAGGLRYFDLAQSLAQGNPRRKADVLHSHASILEDQGEFAKAEAEHRRALALREETLGPDHPHVATSRSNLANTLEAAGKYVEAETEHRRALALRVKVLGAEHPDVASSRSNLAIDLRLQGRYAEAEAEYRQALALQEKTLGPEHPDVATSRNNLAIALEAQGRYTEAEAEHRRALALRERVLGPEHPYVAASRDNLANTLNVQGRYAEAEAENRRALALREKVQGAEHPDIAVSLNNLANALYAQKKYAEAETEYRRALVIRENSLDPEHPLIGMTVNNIALALSEQGKHAEAERELRRGMALLEKALGPEHPSVVWTRSNLASMLLNQGRPRDALPLAEQAWEHRKNENTRPELRAETALFLARALWGSRPDDVSRTRAVAIAQRALELYTEGGDAQAERVAEVETWLRRHRVR